jgi:hypothetical protein
MFRGLAFSALIGNGSAQMGPGGPPARCPECNVDLSALEEFTSDYDVVMIQVAGEDSPDLTTMQLPPNLPSDHGTVAVHVRKAQVKLDNHLTIPAGVMDQLPPPSNGQQAFSQSILRQLAGHEIHEELHINGEHGQASFHLGSPVLNACLQVDVPAPPINHDMLDMQLQQAQQVATMQFQRMGNHYTVDGDAGVGIRMPPHPQVIIFTEDSHPELLTLTRPSQQFWAGLKFSNYVNSVGNAFAVRACEVEAHSATQTMLAENPEMREFFAQRLAEHQSRLQALLEPEALNTRFNFAPLQVAELLMAPVHEGCANDALAETAPVAASTFQTLALGVCSFVTGIAATYGAMRRRKATPSADAYYQVSA